MQMLEQSVVTAEIRLVALVEDILSRRSIATIEALVSRLGGMPRSP